MRPSVVSIVIPAYNEEKTIGNVLEETIMTMESLDVPYEIIVVDDGSSDNTGRIASTFKATLLRNSENRGKGYSVRRGFQQAQGDIVVMIDSDGSHAPKEIPDIIKPLFNGTDIVAGSRFLGTGKYSTTRLNRVGNNIFNFTIFGLTRKRVTDSQTGFRALKKEVIEKLNLQSQGYEIETEITVKGLRNGFKFQEKPISCQTRKHNVSKLRILSDGSKIFRAMLRANTTKIAH